MSNQRYQVSNSQDVGRQLRAILQIAAADGWLDRASVGLRVLMDRLERGPTSFGESREFLPGLQLQMRIAFARPLFAVFGVHEPNRTVFISRIGYSLRRR